MKHARSRRGRHARRMRPATRVAVALAAVTAAATATMPWPRPTEPAVVIPSAHGVPAAPAVYDRDGYRRALDETYGRGISDAAFADFERVARRICEWDGETFAGWVAMNLDDGTLPDVHLDVSYRCPGRVPEIGETVRLIEWSADCVMPAGTAPEIRRLVAGRPAQEALTCALLTHE
ncbi:hypothetical protein [Actinoplanes sp. NPDC049802]|uniref:hypothetical protein n=1 Tax=Actinoplanes sp. NPDC049802 TaxID=3154742 RepID=UPI0033F66E46